MTNNQLTENSVNQLLNSTRLARDNAERDDNRVDHSFYYALTIALEELQERRKAAMDSEPVILYRERNPYNGLTTGWQELTENELSFLKENAGENAEFVTLYRHAQPAVVLKALERMRSIVSDPRALPRRKEWISGQQYSYVLLEEVEAMVDEACRAAMLQAEPVTTANKLGNSSAQSPIDHGYRKGCECSGCKTTVRICAELAGWIPVSERMPETDGNYWGWWSESKRQGPVWFIKSELQAQFQSHEITHWMPLPAAPQEVTGE
ncbi:DUF551 domain-containing protein [Klebsiella variicola]